MSIEIIVKIAAIGILTAVVSQILTHCGKSEIATLATLSGVIIVLVMIVDMVSNLFDTINNIFGLY